MLHSRWCGHTIPTGPDHTYQVTASCCAAGQQPQNQPVCRDASQGCVGTYVLRPFNSLPDASPAPPSYQPRYQVPHKQHELPLCTARCMLAPWPPRTPLACLRPCPNQRCSPFPPTTGNSRSQRTPTGNLKAGSLRTHWRTPATAGTQAPTFPHWRTYAASRHKHLDSQRMYQTCLAGQQSRGTAGTALDPPTHPHAPSRTLSCGTTGLLQKGRTHQASPTRAYEHSGHRDLHQQTRHMRVNTHVAERRPAADTQAACMHTPRRMHAPSPNNTAKPTHDCLHMLAAVPQKPQDSSLPSTSGGCSRETRSHRPQAPS